MTVYSNHVENIEPAIPSLVNFVDGLNLDIFDATSDLIHYWAYPYIASKYGSAFDPPDDFSRFCDQHGLIIDNSGKWLPYHGKDHAQNVSNMAFILAQKLYDEKLISARSVLLAALAGAFHDCEQGCGGDNEQKAWEFLDECVTSEVIVDEEVVPSPFTSSDRNLLRLMILATKVSWENGVMTHDNIDTSYSEEATLLQKAMIDADLSALGSKDGLMQNIRLFAENSLSSEDISDYLHAVVDRKKYDSWVASQPHFHRSEIWQLDISRELLASQQYANYNLMKLLHFMADNMTEPITFGFLSSRAKEILQWKELI